jgi:hypothetical protein
MDANGRAEDGLEQMLWMFVVGAASATKATRPPLASESLEINMRDLREAYRNACGIVPDDAELRRWIGQMQAMLPYLQAPK